MIHVAITEVKHMIRVSCYGHSGKKGESLVCAGVSTLFGALAFSVEDRADFVCESGYGYICYPATPCNKAFNEMFKKGIELISANYPGEISYQ